MTRLEKILMGVLLFSLVATAIFWEDVSGLLRGSTETTADDKKGKDEDKSEKKDKKKDKKDKDDANDDEAYSPSVPFPTLRL